MSLPSFQLSTVKFTIANAISTLRNMSILFLTISVDTIETKGQVIHVEGSYSNPSERGRFRIELDRQMNIINITLSK